MCLVSDFFLHWRVFKTPVREHISLLNGAHIAEEPILFVGRQKSALLTVGVLSRNRLSFFRARSLGKTSADIL